MEAILSCKISGGSFPFLCTFESVFEFRTNLVSMYLDVGSVQT